MNPPGAKTLLSTRRQLELLRRLQRLATARAEAEQGAEEAHRAAVADSEDRARARLAAAEQARAEARRRLELASAGERDKIAAGYESQRSNAQQQYHGLRSEAEAEHRDAKDEARRRAQDEAWEILAVFDAQKGGPQQREGETLGRLRNLLAEVQALEQEAATLLTLRRMPLPSAADGAPLVGFDPADPSASGDGADLDDALADASARVAQLRGLATALYRHRLARLFEGLTPFGVVAGVALVAYAAAAATFGPTNAIAFAAGAGAVAVGAAALWWSARPVAVRGAQELYQQVGAEARRARAAIEHAASAARGRRKGEAVALIDRRNADLARLGFEIDQQLGETRVRVRERIGDADQHFPAELTRLRDETRAAVAAVDTRLTSGLAEIAAKHNAELEAIEAERRGAVTAADERRDAAWRVLVDDWLGGYESVRREAAAMRRACDQRFADRIAGTSTPTKAGEPIAMAVEFGRATVDLSRVKSGLSDDARLRPEEPTFELPALVTLDDQPGLVVTAGGEGRRAATELLQAMALRWLVGQPAGRVRLTVLDPAGLGEGFASLMHLADREENLIAGRIWSEPRDIDEQLLRLTTHLETVIQKYLRSEYPSIHEYNAQAGEVAEPLQVLLVNGFPTNFSEAACRRLRSLMTSGPRCGVYVMLAVDADQPPTGGFSLDDVLPTAVHLDWLGPERRFVWRYPAFEHLPLAVAAPPPSDRQVEIVRRAGEAARAAIRVEVPFAAVAPGPTGAGGGELWGASAGDEFRVPVGRAGANRLQEVRLGKGTAQHLLVAGKTGSGKSTFLHALVTSAALRYPPGELEFYLVDFKKGVEFKAYATHRLPHARVVAIESEREFGLSVLERLDEELARRGEAFRAAGVQSLAEFRSKRPDEPMPRTLLVIDEFQELFVQDDRLAQEATLLLDRLVRQGRAFGVHAVLGTQTLAGAYSLARSTLGQVAVRVALACSESDAHLILSDERNPAARYLSRPGEAIYNDQNGLASANEPFQVVWLPDHERSEWLERIAGHAAERGLPPSDLVVFEGNTPADVATNPLLAGPPATTKSPADARPPEAPGGSGQRPAAAYLGAAVAIKPPTAARFERHAGANLLVVGSEEPSALGMLGSAVLSLAATSPGARFLIADGVRPGEPFAGAWPRVAESLPGARTTGDAVPLVAAAAEEVARREAANDHASPPLVLVLHHAGRFRDLRRRDDDFGFSVDKDKPPSPDKQLATVLRDGPGVGVHVLVWCDSYNAATRLFDRSVLREFACRVAMPMSAADSSNLIDTPAAAQLGQHRALLYNDDTGRVEKFRPYGPPDADWLRRLALAKGAGSAPPPSPQAEDQRR